jgi:short-subunit dehydrogenase
VAADLRTRWNVAVDVAVADAARPSDVSEVMDDVLRQHAVDVALFPVGVSEEDDSIRGASSIGVELVTTNLLGVMAATSATAQSMRSRGHGEIVGFSSVAATRGRSRNPAYAAAKRGLESWFESLRADLADDGVDVGVYVLGYVATNLSYAQVLSLPSASPERIADRVIGGLGRGGGRRYAPSWWRPLAFVLRHVPFAVFRRMKA